MLCPHIAFGGQESHAGGTNVQSTWTLSQFGYPHSSKSTYVLKQKQQDLHSNDLNLSQNFVTCWNSSHSMVERIVKLQQSLFAVLIEVRRTGLMPSDTDISIMEIFLEVFVEITE